MVSTPFILNGKHSPLLLFPVSCMVFDGGQPAVNDPFSHSHSELSKTVIDDGKEFSVMDLDHNVL